MPTIIRGNLRQSGLEMHDGNVSTPPYTFRSSLDSGMFYANGVGFAANGVHAMTITTSGVDVSGVLSGNAAGLTSIQAANVVGLTEALDTIDATSVTANIFVGNGSGLSHVQAANVVGLTEALDTIDATSVTADSVTIASAQPVLELDASSSGQYTGSKIVLTNNATPTTQKNVTMGTFIRDASGENSYFSIDQISNVNSYEKTLARYDLTDQSWSLLTNNTERLHLDSTGASVSGTLSVSNLASTSNITVDAHLLPSANVTKDLGSADFKWRDLYLSSGTLFLGDATIRESGGSLIVPNITANVVSVTGNISAGKFLGDGSELTGISIPPSINTITITDSSWNPIDDTALSTTTTSYFTIDGNNFEATGTTVSVGGTAASSISIVNSSTLRVTMGPKSTGTYDVVVQTSAGSYIQVNGVSFDPLPVWSTASSLPGIKYATPFSITLAASDGGSAITYSNTSALPPSTTLASNGLLAGNISVTNSTTYNFTVEAIDAQLQSALRSFSLVYTYFVASGGTVTTSGGYKYHKFTTNGTFTVAGTGTVDILVVGGGGGGGRNRAGGGAGGQVLNYTGVAISGITASVTVGGGGTGFVTIPSWPYESAGASGGASILNLNNGTTFTAAGGTGGWSDGGNYTDASKGGNSGKNIGGTVTNYTGGSYSNWVGGGGAGANSNGSSPGNGGAGLQVWGTYYGGGGGGGVDNNGSSPGSGGAGGGASGGKGTTTGGTGTNGLGGGGGGGGGQSGAYGGTGGSGGSGVVIIRYLV